MRIVSRRLMIFWRQGPGMRRSRRCLTRCARRFWRAGRPPLAPGKVDEGQGRESELPPTTPCLPLHRGAKPCGDGGLACSRNHPLCARTGGPGAFRLWYQGPPAAFLSTFRRWKVDAVLRARRRGTFPRRAGAKRNAQSRRIANSLPQSPAVTAPSSEGAKGAGIFPARQSAQREQRGGWDGACRVFFYLGRRSSEKAGACSGSVGEVSI